MELNFPLIALLLLIIVCLLFINSITKKRKLYNKLISNAKSRSLNIIRNAKADASQILNAANKRDSEVKQDTGRRIQEANDREAAAEARIERLKDADKELRAEKGLPAHVPRCL